MSDKDGSEHGDGLMVEEELPVGQSGEAPLLKHVETSSGEERYIELLKLKAKIWRFDEGENKWKERGQGDAKILRSKTNSDSHIFVFRREAIGKIAAHHPLFPGMKITVNANDEKTLLWVAPKDYTDDPIGYPERFYIKFATKEMAEEFKTLFETLCKK